MPFPVFPAGDPVAANAWLADESNHDFREWEDASLEDKNKWAELEAALSAVTGLKPQIIMKGIKDAIPDHFPVERLAVRATLEQKRKIVGQAAAAILDNVCADWKDASEKWLMDALLPFTRRAIKLWKKGLNRKGERPEAEGSGEGSPSTSPAKRRRLDARQESRATGNDRVIIPSGNSSSSRRFRSDKSLHPTGQHLQHLDTFLVEVSMEAGTRMPIAAAAIVRDHTEDCSSSDIRAEHLDFEKLLGIVGATDDSWDSQTCEMRWDEDEHWIHDRIWSKVPAPKM